MREHAEQLVCDVKHRRRGLGAPVRGQREGKEAEEELCAALGEARTAWNFGMRNRTTFGAKSFALIGLGPLCNLQAIERSGT